MDDDCAIARAVHTLLTSAHPHASEIVLAKAAELASLRQNLLPATDDMRSGLLLPL